MSKREVGEWRKESGRRREKRKERNEKREKVTKDCGLQAVD